MTERFVVVKQSRMYSGGPGYYGLTSVDAGIPERPWYDSREEAERAAALLSEYNPVGFRVLLYYPHEEEE